MILYGNGREDDSQAIRALLRGEPVLDARLEVEIEAPTLRDLPFGLYRACTPSRWPLDPAKEGWARRHLGRGSDPPPAILGIPPTKSGEILLRQEKGSFSVCLKTNSPDESMEAF